MIHNWLKSKLYLDFSDRSLLRLSEQFRPDDAYMRHWAGLSMLIYPYETILSEICIKMHVSFQNNVVCMDNFVYKTAVIWFNLQCVYSPVSLSKNELIEGVCLKPFMCRRRHNSGACQILWLWWSLATNVPHKGLWDNVINKKALTIAMIYFIKHAHALAFNLAFCLLY